MAKTVDECLREFNFCLTEPDQMTKLQVELWVDCGFKGAKTTVTTGDFPTIADLGIPNDKLSSFKVPKGLTLTVYRDGNFRGVAKVFTGPVDVSCLNNVCLPGSSRKQDGSCNSSWNDRISSLKVRKSTSAPPPARMAAAPAPAARVKAAQASSTRTPASASAAAPLALRTSTAPSTATWVKPGYRLTQNSSIPGAFRLKNATTGQYMIAGPNNTIAEGAGTGVVITKSIPADIYNNAATAGVGMMRLDTPAGAIRHSGFVLSASPYVPNNYDFAWKFLLKNGTTNRIIIWNPYPGDANGMYLQGGARPKIDPGAPTEYIIEPVAAGSGISGYALEGSPFGGPIVRGRNWVLILTLLLVVILLWIIEKNI